MRVNLEISDHWKVGNYKSKVFAILKNMSVYRIRNQTRTISKLHSSFIEITQEKMFISMEKIVKEDVKL